MTALGSHEVIEEGVPADWAGDCPFFLVIELATRPDSGQVGIDLDFPGWATTHRELLRQPAIWWLFAKANGSPVMAVVVNPGDQPYFTRHHVGNLNTASEIVAYGLGKKRPDGVVERVWLLPNGVICGGDDVDDIAARIVNG